jgi:arginase family enzyme
MNDQAAGDDAGDVVEVARRRDLDDVHAQQPALAHPDGGRYYLTIDADGMDPSVMPAVEGPAPGGLTFWAP